MTAARPEHREMQELDEATVALVQLAAMIASSDEADLRAAFGAFAHVVPPEWVDELVVQSYLFCGFPRALNAAREWRRVAPAPVPLGDEADDVANAQQWLERGLATCEAVYGPMYEKLRVNVRALHPALDASMVVEGYGKILSRPGLDLQRRELCIVAACAATGQDRQLHSHLHGSLNVGVSADALNSAVAALESVISEPRLKTARLLLARVLGK